MAVTKKPRLDLARKILPKPLQRVLLHIFDQNIPGCALIGGTALAGFYAGHRRSDDLDLFVEDQNSFNATWRAIQSLTEKQAELSHQFHSNHFAKLLCRLNRKFMNIDLVLDSHLFAVGSFHLLDQNIRVASFDTLLATKAATLVSRCSEKDLFDLMWLFDNTDSLDFATLIAQGNSIDSGVTGDALLMSISSTVLREEACDFALSEELSKKEIFVSISKFRQDFLKGLSLFLHNQPAPLLYELVAKYRRWLKR